MHTGNQPVVESEEAKAQRMGIILGSLASGMLGYTVLRFSLRERAAAETA